MARLVVPLFAYAWVVSQFDGNRYYDSKFRKFHLARNVNGTFVHTVCERYVLDTASDTTEVAAIETLRLDQFCMECLGAMKAED